MAASRKRKAAASRRKPPAVRAGNVRHPNVGADQDFDGKQHYPKVVYAKGEDGKLLSKRVETVKEHEALIEQGDAVWVDNPGDLGIETHPAAEAK